MQKGDSTEKCISGATELANGYAGSGKNLSRRQRRWIFPLADVVLILAAIFFAFIGKERMKESYTAAKEKEYSGISQTAYDIAEARNHVSNYVVISVEGIREETALEVLKVRGSEFVIKNADEKDKTISWLEVQGEGVFTVDLSAAEFIVDTERQFVTVRVPKPALRCNVTDTGERFWNNGGFFYNLFNGNIAEGVHLSQEQMSEGRIKLEDSMRKNRRFHEKSEEAAVNMIKSLVQEWNPDVPDLQVEVEFMESA